MKLCNMSIVDCVSMVTEPQNQGTIALTEEYMSFVHNRLYRSGFSSIYLLDQNLKTTFEGFNFHPFSPYFETFNEKIHEMMSNGIAQTIVQRHVNPKGIRRIEELIGPQVLTMDHTTIGFLICLFPLTFAVVTFLVEIMIHG